MFFITKMLRKVKQTDCHIDLKKILEVNFMS